MIRLVTKTGHELFLEKSHAQRLLNMPNNGGWRLPKDSDYTLTKDGLRKNKAEPAGTKKECDDIKSDPTSKPDKVPCRKQDNA